MWVRFKILHKTWLRWEKESKFSKMKLKFFVMSHLRKTEYSLNARKMYKLKSSFEIHTEPIWTKKSSSTRTKCPSSVRKSMKVTSSTWSSTVFRKRWTLWSSSTRWHVSQETTRVSNSLTKMTSFVFFMRSQTSMRIFWRLESKLSDRRKKRSECTILNWKRDKGNYRLFESKFLKCQTWLLKSISSRWSLISKRKRLVSSLSNSKIQRDIPRRESLKAKMLTLKHYRRRFRCWKNASITRKNPFLRKSSSMRKLQLLLRSWDLKLLMAERVLSK